MARQPKRYMIFLPGHRRRVRAARVSSPGGAMRQLQNFQAVTGDGKNGSITVWRQPCNGYAFQCYLYTGRGRLVPNEPESLGAGNATETRTWLELWWPRMARTPRDKARLQTLREKAQKAIEALMRDRAITPGERNEWLRAIVPTH